MSAESLKRVRYVGPMPRVTVDLPDGGTAVVESGKSGKFPPEVAAGFAGQADWIIEGEDRTRDELNAEAASLGVENPDKLGSKADVEKAINAAKKENA